MKVVFLEEVEGTARVGEVKNVADGFARNYLLPRRLAAPATDHYIGIAQAKAEKEARRQARLDDEARQYLLPKVEGRALAIEVHVGEQGKLFGSVTARDIAEALQAATGVEVEHRQVELRQPLRELGSYDIAVKLSRNVQATVTVKVEPIGGEAAPEAPAEAEAEAVADEAAGDEAAVEAEAVEPEAAGEAVEAEVEDEGEADESEDESADEAEGEEDEAEGEEDEAEDEGTR